MLKKSITYMDYNGNELTEDFYFHLSKAKVADMETSVEGGFSTKLKKLSTNATGADIVRIIKEFISASYGIKSEDGKHFYQSAEISREFESTEAYSELLMELCTNTEAAIEFVSKIFPFNDEQRKEIEEKVRAELPPET